MRINCLDSPLCSIYPGCVGMYQLLIVRCVGARVEEDEKVGSPTQLLPGMPTVSQVRGLCADDTLRPFAGC